MNRRCRGTEELIPSKICEEAPHLPASAAPCYHLGNKADPITDQYLYPIADQCRRLYLSTYYMFLSYIHTRYIVESALGWVVFKGYIGWEEAMLRRRARARPTQTGSDGDSDPGIGALSEAAANSKVCCRRESTI